MWILSATRRELVDLINTRPGRDTAAAKEFESPSLEFVRGESMAVIWPMRPSEFSSLPTALIVPDGAQRDCLAWLTTYVRDFRPFTAFCRVIEKSVAQKFLGRPDTPNLGILDGICTGLILGESLAQSRGRLSVLELPPNAYGATLSHAISRAIAILGRSISLDLIANSWIQTREMTGQNGLDLPIGSVLTAWQVAISAPHPEMPSHILYGTPPDILRSAWSDLIISGELRDGTWRMILDKLPELAPLRRMVEVPRERRIEMLDFAFGALASRRADIGEDRNFLAGYFTSLLAPGTLDHAEVLASVWPSFPSAFLWYGLCASVNFRGEALPAGNAVARRLVRDLTIPDRFVDRPRCDIALEELAMIGTNNAPMPGTSGRLDIDILPGVTTTVRWPPSDLPTEVEKRQFREKEIDRLLAEMAENTARSGYLNDRLRELLRFEENRSAKPKARRNNK
jgi:hypothetical protein